MCYSHHTFLRSTRRQDSLPQGPGMQHSAEPAQRGGSRGSLPPFQSRRQIMNSKTVIAWAVAILLVSQGAGSRLMGADETGDKSAKVLAFLPKSKHTLADGIKQASARS